MACKVLVLAEHEAGAVREITYELLGLAHRLAGEAGWDPSGLKVAMLGEGIDGLAAEVATRGAAEVRTCLLLDKPGARKVEIEADYVGFRIGREFVVGYGLDLAHRFRGLPYIGLIRPG